MKCCEKCFRIMCRCNSEKIDIDHYIYPAIYELNRKGYNTAACCSGHETSSGLSTYIKFHNYVNFDFQSEYVQFESYNYNGTHIRKNKIRIKPDVYKKYEKKRTDKLKLIQEVNRDLYRIAQEAPDIANNEELDALILPDDFFENETSLPRISDMQFPWEIVLPNNSRTIELVEDFFEATDDDGNMYKISVNKLGAVDRLCYKDLSSINKASMKDRIMFDSSSDLRLFQFGPEEHMHLEKINFGNSSWCLSYALTSPHYHVYKGYNDNQHLNALLEIADYLEDNDDEDLLTAFTRGFDYLLNNGVFICAFSSGQDMIVFSYNLDFSYKTTRAGTAAIFGQINYRDTDFRHVSVHGKECFMFSNGSIMLRKELKCNDN